jgi:flagellar biosynthesis protein FlhB
MAETSQDRHLPASARKIEKAREDGQVARSRDLGHFAAIAAGGALMVTLAPAMTGWLKQLIASGLTFDAKSLAGTTPMIDRLAEATLRMMALVLPLGLTLAVVALAAGMLAGGWNWTFKPLMPNFGKLDPWSGLGRVFSTHQLGETLKACALALVLGIIGAMWLRAHAQDFARLLGLPLTEALSQGADALRSGLTLLVLALAAFALIDVPLQRKRLLDRLKMGHQEMKEELRQLEGNLEVKNKMRAKMREVAKRRMLAAVPKADIVVMNPTHYAVALKYDDATMAAPRVVAKGADLLALKIRDIAKEHKVPVLEAPPLARALYAHTEVDQDVPAALFSAVAQVLAWVDVPAELDPHQKAAEA